MNNPWSFVLFSSESLGGNFMFCDLFESNVDFDFLLLIGHDGRHTTIVVLWLHCSVKSRQLSEINFNKYIKCIHVYRGRWVVAAAFIAFRTMCSKIKLMADWRTRITVISLVRHCDRATPICFLWNYSIHYLEYKRRYVQSCNPICGWAKMCFRFAIHFHFKRAWFYMCWCVALPTTNAHENAARAPHTHPRVRRSEWRNRVTETRNKTVFISNIIFVRRQQQSFCFPTPEIVRTCMNDWRWNEWVQSGRERKVNIYYY